MRNSHNNSCDQRNSRHKTRRGNKKRRGHGGGRDGYQQRQKYGNSNGNKSNPKNYASKDKFVYNKNDGTRIDTLGVKMND